jgi:hypothetical protein
MAKRKSLLTSFLGCFMLVSHSLYSGDEDIGKSKNFKKAENRYKKYLENTTWIVPPSTLLAYEYLDGDHVPISDQTVWVINKFDQGYFFGDSYTTLNGTPSSQTTFVGSITPYGDVYIAFYPVSGTLSDTDVVVGIGTLEKKEGKPFFVMQMNSAQNSLVGLSHWSYMINVIPNDYFYQHLPGVNMSVPTFISQF